MTAAEMVVNLHVTERCNYRCTYCFGKWGLLEESGKETSAWSDAAEARRIMRDLDDTFRRQYGRPVRFNFVGGEPALLQGIADLVGYARTDLGARASYVTNGLMLRRFSPEWTAGNVAIVGVSVDSALSSTNLEIGRSGRSGSVFDLGEVASGVEAVREAARLSGTARPEVKVNTVVSELNVHEDFWDVLAAVRPDRWKLLKMLPVYSEEAAASDEAFRGFVRRHRKLAGGRLEGVVITTEDNDQMAGSYAMVDPLARFFWYDGAPGGGYSYSRPMTEAPASEAWAEASWDRRKFDLRYTDL